ncbi:MAG: hypothetical protein DWQ01_13640 [Planctomycetota bacterium]|nr:MAG: hypothetical protein DWQ01_13640 [Planctomycetota bacterium]
MTILLGGLYRDLKPEELLSRWQRRLAELGEDRLRLRVTADELGARLELLPRKGRSLPHRRLGAVARAGLGPDREDLAELWLLEPADADPGPLRQEGASWEACFQALRREGCRQIRLWSPMLCPRGLHRQLAVRGREFGLETREADGWTLMAVPRTKPRPPFPAPWKGNYGW